MIWYIFNILTVLHDSTCREHSALPGCRQVCLDDLTDGFSLMYSQINPETWNKETVVFLSCRLPSGNQRRRYAEWNLQIIIFHVLLWTLAKKTTLKVLFCWNCTWLACRRWKQECTWHWQKLQIKFFFFFYEEIASQNIQNVLSIFLWVHSEVSLRRLTCSPLKQAISVEPSMAPL